MHDTGSAGVYSSHPSRPGSISGDFCRSSLGSVDGGSQQSLGFDGVPRKEKKVTRCESVNRRQVCVVTQTSGPSRSIWGMDTINPEHQRRRLGYNHRFE